MTSSTCMPPSSSQGRLKPPAEWTASCLNWKVGAWNYNVCAPRLGTNSLLYSFIAWEMRSHVQSLSDFTSETAGRIAGFLGRSCHS
mmetsp:Transcript_2624/g.4251  ORF Transcript_2624/g.4251 Transcript_2624/m.4251 type:complete len:86 (+) Transcript_2624:1440-1697(+)